MSTLFVNNLTVVDFSYLHREYGLVGDSWIVDVALGGELNEQNFVIDFGIAKKQIKLLVDSLIDHKLCVPIQQGGVSLKSSADRVSLDYTCKVGAIEYSAPKEAVVSFECEEISMPTVRGFLEKIIAKSLPSNINRVEVGLRREEGEGLFYQYSHGLKKHQGNCQRMAHGHRSTIEIYENEKRSSEWEKYWAQKWRHIYLGSEEDLSQKTEDSFCFSYSSSQGDYRLRVPQSVCILVPMDTTVECIAEYIRMTLEKLRPDSRFKVLAYEGVDKGSISAT